VAVPTPAGAQHRQMTFMFLDLVGATAFSELIRLVYDRFTDRFEYPDLVEAATLMNELGLQVSPSQAG